MARGNHYLIRIGQFTTKLTGHDQLLQVAKRFVPVQVIVTESDVHMLATGPDSYLLLFASQGTLIVEAYSAAAVMVTELQKAVTDHLRLGFNQAEVIDLMQSKGKTVECEEPGCTRPATDDYQGRKVCADHLDWYKEKEFQAMKDDPTY